MLGLTTTAATFQAHGVTALVYDPRGVGISDGFPRNDINPFREVDDMSDAIAFLSSCPSVDPRKGIGLWGMSLGAAVAMTVAALDARVRFVVAVCPATEPTHDILKLRHVLAKAAKDRESRLKGNEPFYVPMVTKKGENPAGFKLGFEHETIMRMLHSQDENDPLRASLASNHVNQTTIGTYRNMLLWDPRHMWEYLTQPILFLLPEHDQIIGKDKQLLHYESLAVPRRLHIQSDAHHMDILEGASQATVNIVQAEFVRDALDGKIVK